MKFFRPKPLLAAVSLAASAMFIALTAHITLDAQEPDAAKQAPSAEGKGGGKAKAEGKGKAAVDTLGEGPWDLKSELANLHVTVVTKGLDHPWGLAFAQARTDLSTR